MCSAFNFQRISFAFGICVNITHGNESIIRHPKFHEVCPKCLPWFLQLLQIYYLLIQNWPDKRYSFWSNFWPWDNCQNFQYIFTHTVSYKTIRKQETLQLAPRGLFPMKQTSVYKCLYPSHTYSCVKSFFKVTRDWSWIIYAHTTNDHSKCVKIARSCLAGHQDIHDRYVQFSLLTKNH